MQIRLHPLVQYGTSQREMTTNILHSMLYLLHKLNVVLPLIQALWFTVNMEAMYTYNGIAFQNYLNIIQCYYVIYSQKGGGQGFEFLEDILASTTETS